MLSGCDKNILSTYDCPTVFTFTFPSDHGGFIVVGDITVPHDVDSPASDVKNNTYFIRPTRSVSLNITKPTRLRFFYYFAEAGEVITYSNRLANYDDITLNVYGIPNVTVDNYGNSVSFNSLTNITLRASMPCELRYKINNLEERTVVTGTHIFTTGFLTHNIQISHTSSMEIIAEYNGNIMPKKLYTFKREPVGHRSYYGFYNLEDTSLINNIDTSPYFMSSITSSGLPSSDIELGEAIFKVASNSIKIGQYNQPIISYGVIYKSLFTTSTYTDSNIARLHYKAIGFEICGESSNFLIRLNDTITGSYDREGWLEGRPSGWWDLGLIVEMTSKVISDCYIEIDAIELFPNLPCQSYYYYKAQNAIINQIDGYYVQHGLYANDSLNPEYLLAVTWDGTEPDLNRDYVPYVGTYAGANRSIFSNCVLRSRIYHRVPEGYGGGGGTFIGYGGVITGSGGSIPVLVGEDIYKYITSFSPSITNWYTDIDDFSLGANKSRWRTLYSDGSNMIKRDLWRVTDKGYESPHKFDYAETNGEVIWDIIGKQVIIDYEIVAAPGVDKFYGEFSIRCNNSIKIDQYGSTVYNYTTYIQDPDPGIYQEVVNLSVTYTAINFTSYTRRIHTGLDNRPQHVIVKSVRYVGKKINSYNDIPLIPNYEDWSGNSGLQWETTGNWNMYVSNVDTSGYFLRSNDINDGGSTEFQFDVDCLDGNITISWGVSSEGGYDYIELWVDGVKRLSLDGDVANQVDQYYVPLGIHTIKIRYFKDGSVSAGYDGGYVKYITFPTLDNFVFNELTVGINTGNWSWTTGEFLGGAGSFGFGTTVTGNERNTLSITTSLLQEIDPYMQFSYTFISSAGTYLGRTCKLSVYTDWFANGGAYDYGVWYTKPWGAYGTYIDGVNLPGSGGYHTIPPISGTITFAVEAVDAVDDITVYLKDITLPVPEGYALTVTPIEDIVEFPVYCEILPVNDTVEIYYTLDGSDPRYSSTALLYTLPIRISEPKIVQYIPYYPATISYGMLESKYYIKEKILDVKLFNHQYEVDNQLYVVFYTFPWIVPIAIGNTNTGYFNYTIYDGKPIAVTLGQELFVGLVTSLSVPGNTEGQDVKFANDIDYFTFEVVKILSNTPQSEWPKPINIIYSTFKQAESFTVKLVPSIPSGVYNHPVTLSLRSNFPECEIKYTITPK